MAAFAGRYVFACLGFVFLMSACQKKAGDTIIVAEGDGTQKVVQSETIIADNSGLKKEISAIKERLDLNEAITRLLRETVGLHEQRITALEQKTTQLEAALKSLNDKVAATQTSLNDINAKIASSNQQLAAPNLTRAQRKVLEDQVKALEAQQLAMKMQLDQLQARTTALEMFRTEQELWNTQFTEKMNALNKDIDALDQRLADVEFNVGLLDEAVEALTRSLLSLKDAMTRLEAEQKRIVNHMATDQELFDTKNAILMALRGEMTDLSENMTAAIDALYELSNTKELCTASEKYPIGLLWFVDLQCGTETIRVLAIP